MFLFFNTCERNWGVYGYCLFYTGPPRIHKLVRKSVHEFEIILGSPSAGQEIPRLTCNPNFYVHILKNRFWTQSYFILLIFNILPNILFIPPPPPPDIRPFKNRPFQATDSYWFAQISSRGHPFSIPILSRLPAFLPWRWRRKVPPKRWYLSTKLLGITCRNI
jgi:hypothetical protein